MSDKTEIQRFFDMDSERKVPLEMREWIPLKASKHVKNDKKFGTLDYRENTLLLNSIMIPVQDKEEALKMEPGDLDFYSGSSSYVGNEDAYHPAEKIHLGFNDVGGISPVLEQKFGGGNRPFWHLNQDIIMAFNLLQEKNYWMASSNGFEKVAKIEFNKDGAPSLLKIRTDYIKDYLCARGMGLYINSYSSRVFVFCKEEKDTIEIKGEFVKEEKDHYRWERFKKESIDGNQNTTMFWSELRKSDWVSPGNKSYHVGRDARSELSFTINTSGDTLPQNKLVENAAANGRLIWLWFKPECVPDLLSKRGFHIEWARSQLGIIKYGLENEVTFGIHESGYLNVYAKEIGQIPYWQQKIWHAHHVKPGDGLAEDLYQARVKVQWSSSARSPETLLINAHNQLDNVFKIVYGITFFSKNINTDQNLKEVHRFVSISEKGLCDLTTELNERFVNCINLKAMVKIIKKNNPGAMKSIRENHPLSVLKAFLITHGVSDNEEDKITTPLSGIRKLRNDRSHRTEQDLSSYLSMANIRENVHPIHQGYDLLNSYVNVLTGLKNIFEEELKSRS